MAKIITMYGLHSRYQPPPVRLRFPSAAKLTNLSASDFDITNFKIDAYIKPVKELEAKATLSVVARQRTRRVMFFELSRFLRVSEVTADGKPAEFIHNQSVEGSHLAKQGNDAVAVILPESLEKGREARVDVQIFRLSAFGGSQRVAVCGRTRYVVSRSRFRHGVVRVAVSLPHRLDAGGHRASTKINAAGGEQTSRKWIFDRPCRLQGLIWASIHKT